METDKPWCSPPPPPLPPSLPPRLPSLPLFLHSSALLSRSPFPVSHFSHSDSTTRDLTLSDVGAHSSTSLPPSLPPSLSTARRPTRSTPRLPTGPRAVVLTLARTRAPPVQDAPRHPRRYCTLYRQNSVFGTANLAAASVFCEIQRKKVHFWSLFHQDFGFWTHMY
eukprot:3817121-Rhodomonas_salina.2